MTKAKQAKISKKLDRSTALLTLVLLIAVICVNLIIPLATLLVKSVDYQPFYQGFVQTLTSKTTQEALVNSLTVTLASCLLSITGAFFFAYIVELKLSHRMKRLFRFLAILPMLVPSITHGLVIVYLFGKMGIVTRLTGVQLPIYGPLGIILGSFFYAFPMAFLVLSQAFANLDGRLFESAVILGARPARRFRDVVLPMMKYAAFSAFAVCFTMIFTDYGIPLSVGGTYSILPLLFYKNVIGMLDFSKGAIYSTILLIPAVAVYLADILYFSRKQAHSTHNIRPVDSGRFHPVQKILFAIITAWLVVPVLIVCVVPFIQGWPYDLTLTLSHFQRIITVGNLGRLVGNSVLMSLLTGILGTALAFTAGYMYVRNRSGFRPIKVVTHGLYMASLAIPGLALGLAYALFFRGTPLYNTLAILVIVNTIHFFGSPYMMVISHFKLLNPNLEAICRTLGGNRFNVLFDVIIPNSRKMLLDVFIYFFTNSMVTISAVSLLYRSSTMTLALQITAYSDQGTWESAVAISLVILAINTIMKLWQNFRLERVYTTATSQPVPDTMSEGV